MDSKNWRSPLPDDHQIRGGGKSFRAFESNFLRFSYLIACAVGLLAGIGIGELRLRSYAQSVDVAFVKASTNSARLADDNKQLLARVQQLEVDNASLDKNLSGCNAGLAQLKTENQSLAAQLQTRRNSSRQVTAPKLP